MGAAMEKTNQDIWNEALRTAELLRRIEPTLDRMHEVIMRNAARYRRHLTGRLRGGCPDLDGAFASTEGSWSQSFVTEWPR